MSDKPISDAIKKSAVRFAQAMGGDKRAVDATRACMDALGLTPRRIDGSAVEIAGDLPAPNAPERRSRDDTRGGTLK